METKRPGIVDLGCAGLMLLVLTVAGTCYGGSQLGGALGATLSRGAFAVVLPAGLLLLVVVCLAYLWEQGGS